MITRSAVKNLNNPDKILRYTWDFEPKSNEDVLFRILFDNQYNYEPGSFMVRISIFSKAHPTMKIYDDCGRWSGPQIQMIFPIICIGNIGYSKECLFGYYIHDHNRIKEDKHLLMKTKEAIKLWNSVFSECSKFVSDNNLAKYREIVCKRLNRQLMNYAFRCNDKETFNFFWSYRSENH